MPILRQFLHQLLPRQCEDAQFAPRLARDLRAVGVTVWIDQLDLAMGMNLSEILEESASVIASPDALRSHGSASPFQ